jgi:hypothetical protein
MLNGLSSYYWGMNAAATKTLAGKVIANGENKGFAAATLLLGASGDVTAVLAAKFTLTPVTAATALYGGTWAT